MKAFVNVIIAGVFVTYTSCTISGLTYMDPLNQKPRRDKDDPCNPLYWYPRDIPEYCYKPREPEPAPLPLPLPPPLPVPIPVPMPPQPVPVPVPAPYPPIPAPIPGPIPAPMSLFPGMPMSAPFMPLPPPVPVFPTLPLPYGIPIIPTNPMVPIGGFPYPYMPQPPMFSQGPPAPMLPKVPGLVSPDGGINILPFTDVYTDMMERHNQKMLKKKLEKLIKQYESKKYKRIRKRRGREWFFDE
ncbi:vegetative cell wall protein gp1-like [Hyposmocoma kahamanoa]|uniref:vegetative cell wall protein gp1-like n=1 Tax=Hyposmocoma kahamanoa TaxID=1477025 RepID=UPI000E6D9F8E|nr:vegetative cell wall protein gp1-like [Hyposmocoma kahamanoa]